MGQAPRLDLLAASSYRTRPMKRTPMRWFESTGWIALALVVYVAILTAVNRHTKLRDDETRRKSDYLHLGELAEDRPDAATRPVESGR
jgi:hypothetical protein